MQHTMNVKKLVVHSSKMSHRSLRIMKYSILMPRSLSWIYQYLPTYIQYTYIKQLRLHTKSQLLDLFLYCRKICYHTAKFAYNSTAYSTLTKTNKYYTKYWLYNNLFVAKCKLYYGTTPYMTLDPSV